MMELLYWDPRNGRNDREVEVRKQRQEVVLNRYFEGNS